MNHSFLSSMLSAWEEHTQRVLLRRFSHLSPTQLPSDWGAVVMAPGLLEIPLHYLARTNMPNASSPLRALFVSSVQWLFECLTAEQMTQLNNEEHEPRAFDVNSIYAPAHFLRFTKRLRDVPVALTAHILLARHYAEFLHVAIEAGAEPLIQNPMGLGVASVRRLARQFAEALQQATGVLLPKDKQLDVLAEVMGYPNGFQQMKPNLPHKKGRFTLNEDCRRNAKALLVYRDNPSRELDEASSRLFMQTLGELESCLNHGEMLNFSALEPTLRGLTTVLFNTPWTPGNFVRQSQLNRAISSVLMRLLSHVQPEPQRPRPARPRATDTSASIWHAAILAADELNMATYARHIVESYHPGDDGLDLMRALEKDCGWELNRDDLDALDAVDSVVSAYLMTAEWLWVQLFGYEPPFPVGTQIKEGTIDTVDGYRPACYLVKAPGTVDTEHSKTRRVVMFERAQLPMID